MSTAIALRFPAGRYHATPWATHVNEAEVEWPPSSWRLLRGLIATWHRKAQPTEIPEEALAELIHALAETAPWYRLPSASHAHVRHYMPERVGTIDKPTLIFDAFARVDPDEDLVVAWPDLELSPDARTHLTFLLERLGYLGRAESWVEARLLEAWDGAFDCAPAESDSTILLSDPDLELLRLPSPVPPESYGAWRNEQVEDLGLTGKTLKKGEKRLLATLPERLIDAMRLDTAQFQKEGWSRAPGLRYVRYERPRGALEPVRVARARSSTGSGAVTTVRLMLRRCEKPSSPLPRLVDALKIGERVRWAAINRADQATDTDGNVPPLLSGHDMPSENRHAHAFYLPEDASEDGRLDHILIHAAAGFGPAELDALDRIDRLWLDEGAEWRVTLEDYGGRETYGWHPYLRRSRVWQSVTPYLHPWYRKKGFMHVDQIRRECRERGLPEPEAERLDSLSLHGRTLRAVHFHRFRNRKGLRQPDTRGSFWRLCFPEPVAGPIALGFGCHFGLGIFRAEPT
jgi:CRISPR-associated protein Csb2